MRLSGKGFDGLTAQRMDRHLRQIAGNVTRFPEFLPRSVPIRDIMEVTSCNTQSSAPEDGQNNCPKHVKLIGIDKPFLHLVGCLYYLHFITL